MDSRRLYSDHRFHEVSSIPETGIDGPILDLSCKRKSERHFELDSPSPSDSIYIGSGSNSPTTTIKCKNDQPQREDDEHSLTCSNFLDLPSPPPPVLFPLFQSSTSQSTSTFFPKDSVKKIPRPFKAYPKDPLTLTMDRNSNEAYTEFRNRMLDSVRRTSGEGTNVKMRRVKSSSPGLLPTSTVDEKDAAYWERRRKNNEAAKRSRDARRAKEDEIAIRAAFLEQENMKLKYEVVALRNEAAKLRCMIYST